ncbi:MAG: c-type cytochrome [Chloroflexi bacterium]|nr:c-type cytochrome [Chloroflexota bacterium]MCI0646240.1 c-type cytochrome [Chloroflexota bacterium]
MFFYSSLVCFGLAALLALFTVKTSAGQGPVAPLGPPDATAGLVVFSERCANCHGERALGDGELAANLPNPPAALASPDYLRAAVPALMFDTITNGRAERGMPPFGPASSNPLDEASRWDAIAAVYSLGTPAEAVERGQAVYEENCLACHGVDGQGNGLADQQPPDLTDLVYWANTSNQAVFDRLNDPAAIPTHDYTLEADDLWAVVDYARTFSYGYTDALAAFRPLELATISGQVTNGTTGEVVTANVTAQLRAFTQELEITLTLTETIDAEGRFQFDLSDVPQDWFYRVAVTYEGVEFGSDFGQLTFSQPSLELPVIVYEQTTDPAAIRVDQLHIVLEFSGDNQVQVNELYVVNNEAQTVFMGETGNTAEGTFQLSLPAGAESPEFQRGFGSLDSFFPTDELIATETGWADTLPVRPGQGALMLLARYTLPYDNGATVAHLLPYLVSQANLVLPDGVSLDGEATWTAAGQQSLAEGVFVTYSRSNLPAGSAVDFTLRGRPRSAATTTVGLIRDETGELLLGAGALLAAAAAAVFLARAWRLQGAAAPPDREALLQAIADLDDAHAAGEVGDKEYRRERQELKKELMTVWEATRNE